MDEQSLKLSLHIMQKEHANSYLLGVVILKSFSIYLLLEHNQKSSDQHWPEILDQEHDGPRNLLSQIFED